MAISLNSQIRKEVVDSVMNDWDKANPPPDMGSASVPSVTFLTQKRVRQDARNMYLKRLSMALSTFKTVDQLKVSWPEISVHIPDFITNPREAIDLP